MNAQKKSAPPTQPPSESSFVEPLMETLDLKGLIGILRVRRKIVIGTVLGVLALTLFVLTQMTPRYTARALVMLDQRERNVVALQAVLSGLPTDPTSVENQVQILYSRNLMARVADSLQLVRDPEFNPPKRSLFGRLFASEATAGAAPAANAQPQGDAVKAAVVDRLTERMGVSIQGRSTAIQIRYTSSDPEKAARIANAIATAYVEDQLNAKFEATQAATRWLSDRVRELGGQVQSAEVAAEQYRTRFNLTESPEGETVSRQQLAQLNAQLVLARSDLAEQEARFARVAELRTSGRAADVSQAVASPLIAELRTQEATLLRTEAELSSRYGPRHPRMIDIESQKKNLTAKIDEEVQRVVETVGNDMTIARARVQSLERSLAELVNRTEQESNARVRLRELESSAASARTLYESFLTRYRETQEQQDIQAPDARIISAAEVPFVPSFPNKTLAFGIAIPGGLFLGLLFAMMAEKLDPGFRTGLQVERATGLPVLAVIPETPDRNPADRIVEKPLSAFAESIRGLQMGLVLSGAKRPKVILVTSSVPDEGKTTVAISLARLAARGGQKVALVDGDLRNPNVGKSIGNLGASRGLIHFLSGECPLEECLTKDPMSDALVLPVVGKADSAPDLLGSSAMERLIRALAGSRDLVVVDGAPLLPVNDSKILARLANAAVLVVRWEKTPREAVMSARRSLTEVEASIAGVVLSRADRDRHSYYSFGYGANRKYNKYYTE